MSRDARTVRPGETVTQKRDIRSLRFREDVVIHQTDHVFIQGQVFGFIGSDLLIEHGDRTDPFDVDEVKVCDMAGRRIAVRPPDLE